MADGSGIHGPIIGRGAFIPPNVRNTDKNTGLGEKPVAFWTFGCQGVEIEVDIETGQIKVLKVASCFDVGKIVNPRLIEAQVEGAIVQGIGSALWEEIIIDEKGKVRNPNFVDYKIPTADDMPEMDVNIFECNDNSGTYGAKSIGEPATEAVAAAIANAIYNATGKRIRENPANLEKVLLGEKLR